MSPVLIPSMSINMDEHFILVHKVIDVVDGANRKICVTLLRSNVEKPESSSARDQFFGQKKKDENFQQIVSLKHKLEEFFYLLDAMGSLCDKGITNHPNGNVL